MLENQLIRHLYLLLYVFCGTRLLAAYLRPSDIDAAMHSRAILKLLVNKDSSAMAECEDYLSR